MESRLSWALISETQKDKIMFKVCVKQSVQRLLYSFRSIRRSRIATTGAVFIILAHSINSLLALIIAVIALGIDLWQLGLLQWL